MTALSVRCELRNRYRSQDTDNGDHHQQLYKRKTGFILKSQSIHLILSLSINLFGPIVFLGYRNCDTRFLPHPLFQNDNPTLKNVEMRLRKRKAI